MGTTSSSPLLGLAWLLPVVAGRPRFLKQAYGARIFSIFPEDTTTGKARSRHGVTDQVPFHEPEHARSVLNRWGGASFHAFVHLSAPASTGQHSLGFEHHGIAQRSASKHAKSEPPPTTDAWSPCFKNTRPHPHSLFPQHCADSFFTAQQWARRRCPAVLRRDFGLFHGFIRCRLWGRPWYDSGTMGEQARSIFRPVLLAGVTTTPPGFGGSGSQTIDTTNTVLLLTEVR